MNSSHDPDAHGGVRKNNSKTVSLVLFCVSATVYAVGALVVLDLAVKLGDRHILSYMIGVAISIAFLALGLLISAISSVCIYRLGVSLDRALCELRRMSHPTRRPASEPVRRHRSDIDPFDE